MYARRSWPAAHRRHGYHCKSRSYSLKNIGLIATNFGQLFCSVAGIDTDGQSQIRVYYRCALLLRVCRTHRTTFIYMPPSCAAHCWPPMSGAGQPNNCPSTTGVGRTPVRVPRWFSAPTPLAKRSHLAKLTRKTCPSQGDAHKDMIKATPELSAPAA